MHVCVLVDNFLSQEFWKFVELVVLEVVLGDNGKVVNTQVCVCVCVCVCVNLIDHPHTIQEVVGPVRIRQLRFVDKYNYYLNKPILIPPACMPC